MMPLNISLPEQMREFIDEQVAVGGYSTASEYIQDLIRQEQERVTQQQVESLLLEGVESGEPIEATDEWWEHKRAQLVERIRHGNG